MEKDSKAFPLEKELVQINPGQSHRKHWALSNRPLKLSNNVENEGMGRGKKRQENLVEKQPQPLMAEAPTARRNIFSGIGSRGANTACKEKNLKQGKKSSKVEESSFLEGKNVKDSEKSVVEGALIPEGKATKGDKTSMIEKEKKKKLGKTVAVGASVSEEDAMRRGKLLVDLTSEKETVKLSKVPALINVQPGKTLKGDGVLPSVVGASITEGEEIRRDKKSIFEGASTTKEKNMKEGRKTAVHSIYEGKEKLRGKKLAGEENSNFEESGVKRVKKPAVEEDIISEESGVKRVRKSVVEGDPISEETDMKRGKTTAFQGASISNGKEVKRGSRSAVVGASVSEGGKMRRDQKSTFEGASATVGNKVKRGKISVVDVASDSKQEVEKIKRSTHESLDVEQRASLKVRISEPVVEGNKSGSDLATDENEGYGSYYMPCCPCSAHLEDQPCQPKCCFSYKYLDWLTVVALITCFCWGTMYCILPETSSPRGALFTLGVASVTAYAAGQASAYFMRLPPSLFMFLVGFAYRNSPVWDTTKHFTTAEVEAVKALCLTVMATKAALYFDWKVFLKYPLTIILLGVVPCVGEISTVGAVIFAITELDLATSFTTATVIANVSSTVIAHSLVTLYKSGYGAQTGIISILMAAAPIDGIIVLVVLGVLVEHNQGVWKGLYIFGEQLAGIASGALLGTLLAFFPSRNNVNVATLQRTLLHILSIMCVQLLCHTLGLLSVGHLFNTAAACATINFLSYKKWTLEVMMLKDTFEMIWEALQPVAVILVCTIIDFQYCNTGVLWQALCIFMVSYGLRMGLVLLSTQFSKMPFKERFFISLCWTARGITQGIMAGTLMAFVASTSTPDQSRDIMTIFVVNLIVGNIIGGLQIWFLGPLLVPKNDSLLKV